MSQGQIDRCQKRMAFEERFAREASSPDLAVVRQQAAMLYRAELTMLRSKRARAVGEMLADIW
jgi:hypothetical protein